MDICIAGMGKVGASLAALLATRHRIRAYDIDAKKVTLLERGESPVDDPEVQRCFAEESLDIQATTDAYTALEGARMVLVSVPTDFDPITSYFNTLAVEDVVEKVQEVNPRAVVVIRSTVPVGFTDQLASRYPGLTILFSPEFLREGHAIQDNVYPSRIIVGTPRVQDAKTQAMLALEARRFGNLLLERSSNKDVSVLVMGSSEAEAVKLFSNTYLAMRIAFFNELDTYSFRRGLNVEQIIEGVSLDSRIGKGYNNSSFGFGGYCLPKDTKQLLSNFEGVPQRLVAAVVESNQTRKDAIVEEVFAQVETIKAEKAVQPLVGVYRLGMKADSNSMRESSVLDVLKGLLDRGVNVLIYEPTLSENSFWGCEITHDLDAFLERSTLIVANRLHEDIASVADKVFSRDLFLDD